ncbi:hypothetical protein IQ235_00795 [Oscillatoriales cyanobacterium LEGE 11467]|uniref:FHA domain containing protein n=1 Tax=Zarconia navalis LEGE 11467 TaxID=1828826 RepID=A0A928VV85_9CYAN|nr:hypothetical protein [Zarconia navalis]MBE9039332.1 hypothetical protein [Zarconia navalis LEGE 11467]
MSRKNWPWHTIRTLLVFLAVVAISSSAIGCSDGTAGGSTGGASSIEPPKPEIVEVSPPATLQELRRDLDFYRPQVSITSPEPDTVLEDETVTVQLQVRDLPTFKDDRFGLGPYLNVILDDRPYIAIYDPSEPLVLEDISPGTHTLRVFASLPWHESFKNDGAYAQTTFHIYTQTDDNRPDPTLPLLTYSRPQGNYGAEPIMLDYYLTNAPLHLIARESTEDEIVDWQIRWTIDGKSFSTDRWQPIYIQGFAPGKHWVQLEFLDEFGNPVKNTFNNTVRTIVYEPGGEDALSKLVRGELSASEVRGIVDPNYVYVDESKPEEELLPEESESEILEESAPEPLDEEPVEAETLPEVLEESVPDTLDEEPIEVETFPEILDEEPIEVETLPEILDEEPIEVETLPEILDEEPIEVETLPEILNESASEILDEEPLDAGTFPEEELTLMDDIEKIEPTGEEQMEDIETIEIELPDLGLYPTIPRGLDVPVFLELEEESQIIEPTTTQLDRDIVEEIDEMSAMEGEPATFENPIEEIELP